MFLIHTAILCLGNVRLQHILEQASCSDRRWTALQQQVSDFQRLVQQYVLSEQNNKESNGKYSILHCSK